jgi:hypothetical protein
MFFRTSLCFVLAAGLGWLVGHAASPTPTPSPPPAAPPKVRAGVTCVDVAAPAAPCPELEAQITTCESALAGAGGPSLRQPFADVPESDQPGPWNDTLEAAIRDCGIPAEIVATDCDEAPCAAALRIREEDRDRAHAAMEACPAWQAQGLSTARLDVHCPDGSVDVADVAITYDDQRWKRILPGGLEDRDDAVAYAITFGRRAESVLQLWDCNVAAR